MKVRVNRFMRGGICFVGFQSVDVTANDNEQFQKFGIPVVQILIGNGPRSAAGIAISSLNPSQTAGFNDPHEAEKYEERVLNDIKVAYKGLQEKRDAFTSTREVEL